MSTYLGVLGRGEFRAVLGAQVLAAAAVVVADVSLAVLV